jgi:hypothetical protein
LEPEVRKTQKACGTHKALLVLLKITFGYGFVNPKQPTILSMLRGQVHH